MTGDEKARDRAARVGSARDEGARAGVLAALPDQADRDLARDALDRTIFVTAGAGAGKTSVLVHRICALVTNAADPVPIQAVAAVTFTEKAAAEMRDRVRAELTERAHGEDERVAELAREALDDLDLAAIGTLHSFAARLLRESPIEAKLPPVITALDEVASGVRGERWWRRVHADLQQGEDTALAMQVLLAMAVGVDALKEIAQAMQANWDLVQDRFAAGGALGGGASGGLAGRAPAASTGRAATRAPTDPSAAVRPAASVRALVLDIDPLRRAVTAMERRAAEECRRDSDRLHARVGALREWLNSIEAAGDDFERLALLTRPFTRRRVGTQANWDDVDSARAQVEEAVQTGLQARAAFIGAALDIIVSALASAVLTEADARRRDGTLLFQDLLVLARNMLRTSEAARLAAHGRYRRLLLDEFQDTDPLQIEIAVRIVAGAQGGHERWQDCPVPAGSLFVVGDPKQSIYRFRRANIATFLAAQDVLSGAPGESGGSQGPGSPAGGAASGGTGAPGVTGALRTGALGGTGAGGRAASLRTNFRSHPAVLDWVNAVFARLIRFEPDGQPPYVPLEPAPDRVALHAGDSAPRVTVLGAEALGEKVGGDVLREREAREVAGAIARMLRDRPVVESRRGGQWISRPVQEDDICVLVPARTSLKELEKALDHLNIPFRTEASSLVYRSDEVRDLLLTARAIDDPTDGLALVESLRTPLFGCGDDDLLTWKEAGGRFSIFASRPESLDESYPVADSLVFLRRMARQRSQLAPSELLATIVAERRALEVATDTPMYRETWRRLRFVVDQARAWSEAEHGSLRDFLDWATRQGIEEEKANEIVLPDKDTRSIRILTVHAAKGLEFPVVVLSGMTTSPSSGAGRVVWPDAGPPEVSARQGVSSRDWEESSEREKRMLSLEALRLLYVAATRAESRLVVSLVREFDARGSAGRAVEWAGPSGAGTSDEGGADIPSGTRAALLAWAAQGAGHEAWSAPEDGVPPLPVAPRNPTPPVPWADWVAIRDSARAAASRREADSATDIAHGHAPVPEGLELAPGLLKEPRDLELLAWLKGRYGAAVGRAVHGTLQTVDLRTGIGLDGIAEAQALAEGVLDRVGDVRALARAGWESATIRAAAAREHHKETYVGTVIGDQLIEGYIDLLFRDDDGSLVVVDYKTDATPTAETVAAYRGQLAVYARALGDATGDRVSRCVLVFCREGGAVEMTVPSAVQSS